MKIEPSLRKKAVFFVITTIIALSAIIVSVNKTSTIEGFYFSENKLEVFEENPFLEVSNNFIVNDTLIDFVSGDSIVAHSSPLIYTGKSLGSLHDYSLEEDKKAVIEYLPEKGETITSVAEKFNISVNTVLWANKITNKSTNVVNRKIVILPTTGIIHEVRKNDTVAEIAKKYKAKIEDIVSFNELEDESSIYIGDILIIPDGVMPVEKPKVAVVSTPSVSGFIAPAKGYISQGLHYYNAIDIANRCGTPIYASASGTIQRTGYHNIGGYYVRIIHPSGVVTYYGHLSKISVVKNQKVSQGQIIGYMGNTGYTIGPTGCHTHFEVRGATNPFAKYRVGYRF